MVGYWIREASLQSHNFDHSCDFRVESKHRSLPPRWYLLLLYVPSLFILHYRGRFLRKSTREWANNFATWSWKTWSMIGQWYRLNSHTTVYCYFFVLVKDLFVRIIIGWSMSERLWIVWYWMHWLLLIGVVNQNKPWNFISLKAHAIGVVGSKNHSRRSKLSWAELSISRRGNFLIML